MNGHVLVVMKSASPRPIEQRDLRRLRAAFFAAVVLVACSAEESGAEAGGSTSRGESDAASGTSGADEVETNGEAGAGSETGPGGGSQTGGESDGGSTGTPGGSTGDTGPRRVVLYWGHGGFDPARVELAGEFAGAGGFSRRASQLSDAGFEVEYTDAFPADLSDADMVVLIRPGRNSGQTPGEPFSSAEIDELRAVLESGGVVAIGGEGSAIWGHDEANRVAAELGVGSIFATGVASEYEQTVPVESHPLTDGVSTLMTLASGRLSPGSEASCLASIDGTCILAVEPAFEGHYVALGDLQMIDDYSADADVDGLEFLVNLAEG